MYIYNINLKFYLLIILQLYIQIYYTYIQFKYIKKINLNRTISKYISIIFKFKYKKKKKKNMKIFNI